MIDKWIEYSQGETKMSFLCMLWPYLAGGLIGWLLAGWFARRLKYSQAPVERIVEKHVEKIVDNPEHLALISKLQNKIANEQKTVAPVAVASTVIDLKAAKAAGLEIETDTDFTVIEGIGPQINNLIHDAKVSTFMELADSDVPRIQKILDDAGPRFKIANPSTWPDQAYLAANNRWSALKALQDVLDGGVYPNTRALKKSAAAVGSNKSTEKAKQPEQEKSVIKIDTDAAKAAGFKVKKKDGQDDFTVIEGIGPKINGLIHADNIHSYAELSETKVEVIQDILDKAGPSYKLAKPGTWPKQAEMAANNRWDALKAWQDELDGGV